MGRMGDDPCRFTGDFTGEESASAGLNGDEPTAGEERGPGAGEERGPGAGDDPGPGGGDESRGADA